MQMAMWGFASVSYIVKMNGDASENCVDAWCHTRRKHDVSFFATNNLTTWRWYRQEGFA